MNIEEMRTAIEKVCEAYETCSSDQGKPCPLYAVDTDDDYGCFTFVDDERIERNYNILR